jgi:hypothetical protein
MIKSSSICKIVKLDAGTIVLVRFYFERKWICSPFSVRESMESFLAESFERMKSFDGSRP